MISGPSYTTKWTATGNNKTITAAGPTGQWIAKKENITVVGVKKVVRVEGTTQTDGPIIVPVGTSVSFKALRDPGDAMVEQTGPFPADWPKWSFKKSTDMNDQQLESQTGNRQISFSRTEPGEYIVKAQCGTLATEISLKFVLDPDLDVDSNNDGIIATGNELTEDAYKMLTFGKVIPVTTSASAQIFTTRTTGKFTLSCSLGATVLAVKDNGGNTLSLPATWNLDNGETLPLGLTLTALSLDDDPGTAIGLGNASRSGTLILEHDSGFSDVVQVLLTVPASRTPKNNRAASWEPFPEFQVAGPKIESYTMPLGYDWVRYRDSVTFGDDQVSPDIHSPLSWAAFKALGQEGLLVIAAHGSTTLGFTVIWRSTEAEILDFVGATSPSNLPAGTSIVAFARGGGTTPGFLLVVNAAWVLGQWKSTRDTNRAIGLFMACHMADIQDGSNISLIDVAGGAEVFGYRGTCNQATHEHDIDLLFGRLTSSDGHSRAAGTSYDRGGYTDTDIVSFKRSTHGNYWTTLSPALLAVSNNNGAVANGSEDRIGFSGMVLDTQRDDSVSAEDVITIVGGDGELTSGLYNIVPFGCGCEFLLHPAQSLQLFGNKTKVYDDEDSKSLLLNSSINWTLTD